ncbi:MAG: Transcriptional regulator, AraC family, partial [uncultured Friedmanniella sp.]
AAPRASVDRERGPRRTGRRVRVRRRRRGVRPGPDRRRCPAGGLPGVRAAARRAAGHGDVGGDVGHRGPRPRRRPGQRPGDRVGHRHPPGRRLPDRGARGPAHRARRRLDPPQPVLRLLRAGRGGAAGRPGLHHALAPRRRPRTRPPARPDRPAGPLRRRRQHHHQCGHRGEHRRVPARGPARAGDGRGHQDRPADGGAAPARRRSAAVRRDADPGVHRRQPLPAARLGAGPPRRAAHRQHPGPPGHHERPHVRPPVQRRDGDHAAPLAHTAADPGRPRPAGGDRPRGRADRRAGRVQLRRRAARALPPRDRPAAGGLPAPLRRAPPDLDGRAGALGL